jgi:hypothetical protein
MNSFFRKLRWFAHRRDKEAELREELQFHLQEEASESQASGLTQNEARQAARRELGNLTLVEENTRAAWGWTLVEQLGQDLRYAFRTMAASRLFTLLAVASLGLGIGANTAIYSFMDAILLRALPVSDPGSLVVLSWHSKTTRRDFVMHSISGTTHEDLTGATTAGIFPFPAFELFRKNDSIFSIVFGHFPFSQARRLNLTFHGQASIASGVYVSGGYFHGLGVLPAVGRLVLPDDDRPGAPAVAVASYGFCQRVFGGTGDTAGQSISIDSVPFTVVGVAPPEFFGVDPAAAPMSSFRCTPMNCWERRVSSALDPRPISTTTTIGSRSWGDYVRESAWRRLRRR